MPKPKCVKCGSTDIHTIYHHAAGEPEYQTCGVNHGSSRDRFPREKTEHLHRTCRNCQYEWIDPTSDNVKTVRSNK